MIITAANYEPALQICEPKLPLARPQYHTSHVATHQHDRLRPHHAPVRLVALLCCPCSGGCGTPVSLCSLHHVLIDWQRYNPQLAVAAVDSCRSKGFVRGWLKGYREQGHCGHSAAHLMHGQLEHPPRSRHPHGSSQAVGWEANRLILPQLPKPEHTSGSGCNVGIGFVLAACHTVAPLPSAFFRPWAKTGQSRHPKPYSMFAGC